MGSCSRKIAGNTVIKYRLSDEVVYSTKANLNIKERNDELVYIGSSSCSFALKKPVHWTSKQINVLGLKYLISDWILPGQDPRGTWDKAWQDTCNYITDGQSLLLTLFDGHGKNGRAVAIHLEQTIQDFYIENQDMYMEDPKQFLNNMWNEWNEDLTNSKIDIKTSGSACVVILFYNNQMNAASIGDARCVLGTTDPPKSPPAIPHIEHNESPILQQYKKRRTAIPKQQLESVQLTKVQRADDPEEFLRIISAGGRVQKALDTNGNQIGPFRVWRAYENTPGLAMARSMGDSIARDIGVISEPQQTEYQVNPFTDHFIVLASDGIWDVMDNDDVIDFVEYFRHSCKQNFENDETKTQIAVSNSWIAQLLWEEARFRWFRIIEEEDVVIDDISWIVLEFNALNNQQTFALESVIRVTSPSSKSTEDVSLANRDTVASGQMRKDIRRTSILE